MYLQISCIRLVGILLVVYVEHKLVRYITDVDSDLVPCGIMGHLVSYMVTWTIGWTK